MKYSNAFEKVIYHTNSVDLADFYTPIFNNEAIKNFEFVITPVKKQEVYNNGAIREIAWWFNTDKEKDTRYVFC